MATTKKATLPEPRLISIKQTKEHGDEKVDFMWRADHLDRVKMDHYSKFLVLFVSNLSDGVLSWLRNGEHRCLSFFRASEGAGK